MKKVKRIKWGNVLRLIISIIGGFIILCDFIKLSTSLLTLTYLGCVFEIIILILTYTCTDYLIKEWRNL